MPDWDRDGPEIEANLVDAQRAAAEHALARRALTASDVKEWHRTTMRGLDIDDARTLGVDPAELVGEFRGPPKLAGIEVKIGSRWGVAADRVAAECEKFFATLNTLLEELDRRFPADELDDLDPDAVRAVAEAAAWAHSEWVRIHPFANGNGRTSRLIGNSILVRFGLPPVFRLRPRPGGSYPVAAAAAMAGDHGATAGYVVNQLLDWGRAR